MYLYERQEDSVVELDEVSPLLPVLGDGGGAGTPARGRGRPLVTGTATGTFGRLSLGAKQDRAVDVAGGLGLRPVMLHDVREVLLVGFSRNLKQQ